MVQGIEHFQEMPHASSETVAGPHQHNIKLATVGRGQHLVECRTLRLCAADLVGVLVNDFEPAVVESAQSKSESPDSDRRSKRRTAARLPTMITTETFLSSAKKYQFVTRSESGPKYLGFQYQKSAYERRVF